MQLKPQSENQLCDQLRAQLLNQPIKRLKPKQTFR